MMVSEKAAENNPYIGVLRAPHQFSVDVTNCCNLRCLHCYNSSGENSVMQSELSDAELLELGEELVRLKPHGCCVCGGEPLLRANVVCSFIRALSQNDIYCSMVTNGLLLTEPLLERLVASGLTSIQFSLDGSPKSHERLRRHQGAFEPVAKAIEMVLNKTDLRLSIAFCPTSFNIEDLDYVYDFLKGLYNASGRLARLSMEDYIDLRFQPLMLLGRARQNRSIRPDESQYRKLVSWISEKQQIGSTRIEIEWGDPVDHLIRHQSKTVLVDQVHIRANGDITVSPYIPLVVGNVRRHSVAEYWNAGLSSTWHTDLVRAVSSHMVSMDTMERVSDLLGDVNMGNDIDSDLIECNRLNDAQTVQRVVDLLDNSLDC